MIRHWKRPHSGDIWNYGSAYRPHQRSFSKTPFQPEEFENAGVSFSCERKTFWKRNFRKWWRRNNHVIFLTEFSSNTNPKYPVIQLCFQIPQAQCGLQTFDAFSEWNLRFQIPAAWCVRDLSLFIFDKRVGTMLTMDQKQKSWICSDLRVQPDLYLSCVSLCLLWCSCEYSKCMSTQVLWNLFEVFNKEHKVSSREHFEGVSTL